MTQGTLIFLTVAVALLGAGTFLLLPHRHGKVRPRTWHYAGAALAAVGVLLMAALWEAPSNIFAALFFYGFGLIAMGGGVLMITSKNPVHSALWFAMVVLSTSGLFLLAGAQFLAAGTIIVYAGAIIVTFLFVIMLAQAEGQALYDRLARSPGRSALVAFLMLLGILYAVLTVKNPPTLPNTNAKMVETTEDGRLTPSFDLSTRVGVSEDAHLQAVIDRS
ncbi:MAG TPA: NADH-quinone oxidoreductase subunit J, partial [Isosphaeraceae bacterium]|nr:NADH-quinone oxidoreductase subunit J [Isosphaeraceae bacterium]